jgi:hypothetical protein
VTPLALQLWRAIVDPDRKSCSRHRATVSMKDDNASIVISSGGKEDENGTGKKMSPVSPRLWKLGWVHCLSCDDINLSRGRRLRLLVSLQNCMQLREN